MSAPPARGGMSLYANLLESNADSSTSISRDPVLFKQEESTDNAPKRSIDPALRFQPIRRPQVKQPNKPKPSFPKAPPASTATAAPASGGNGSSSAPPAAPQPRSTLADWAATEDDDYLYGGGEKRQRGGRRKKRKKADDAPLETDWDELYDPARPTNVEEYLRSEERIREVREWKAVLYAHRRQRASTYDSEMGSDKEEEDRRPMNQFAPPSSLSFAPPPISPPWAPAAAADAATGDDAYARRLALSGMAPPPAPPSPPPPPPNTRQPPPPTTDNATISRAPVRYEAPPIPPAGDGMDLDDEDGDDEVNYSSIPTLPPPPADDDANADTGATTLPGQAGFAQRLMAKYGWTKGSGLGADEAGITSALRVQVEKRRRRPDAEGGGFAEPGGRGKIIAGKHASADKASNGGKFGKMSEVIVLRNMLEGMPDLEAEIEAGLGQEIGEECGDKYGRVERLYIEPVGRLVFIKFTDQVSALRAVNALEGRIFNGNTITPRFYDVEKFENGEYS